MVSTQHVIAPYLLFSQIDFQQIFSISKRISLSNRSLPAQHHPRPLVQQEIPLNLQIFSTVQKCTKY